jgi:hypothetical protein
MHNQTDHTLIVRRWHLNILRVRSFRAANCDADHYLVVAKARERLAVGKQTTCGMSVFTATTTYNFVAGRRKLFQAGCACWIPGGAFCIAVSWLAGWRRKLGPCKGPSCFFFSVKTVAPRRAVLFLYFSAEQRAGDADDLWRRR